MSSDFDTKYQLLVDKVDKLEYQLRDVINKYNELLRRIGPASTGALNISSDVQKCDKNELSTLPYPELIHEMGRKVYSQIIADINNEIVPKVNDMIEFVKYQNADGCEIATDYRRAVNEQANPHLKLITDGRPNRQIIQPYVSLFFEPDDDD